MNLNTKVFWLAIILPKFILCQNVISDVGIEQKNILKNNISKIQEWKYVYTLNEKTDSFLLNVYIYDNRGFLIERRFDFGTDSTKYNHVVYVRNSTGLLTAEIPDSTILTGVFEKLATPDYVFYSYYNSGKIFEKYVISNVDLSISKYYYNDANLPDHTDYYLNGMKRSTDCYRYIKN